MIIWVRFTEAVGNINSSYKWYLFMVPDTMTMLETFDGIYSGKYSCGRELQFEFYNRERVMYLVTQSTSATSNDSEVVHLLLTIRLCELKETGSSSFVQFE